MTAKILIIDDDKGIRTLLGKFLQKNGFDVDTAENAKVAKSLLIKSSQKYNLLILDVMMPGMTGLEFAELLRKEDNTPILMLSALGTPKDKIKGLQLGVDDYLAKPFEPEELLLRIKNILKTNNTEINDNKSATKVKFGEFIFDLKLNILKKNDNIIPLTSNEALFLNNLCMFIGNPLSRENLAKAVSGVSERSVDVQITRLRSKIEEDPKSPIYLQTIRNKGYALYGEKIDD